MRSFMFLSTAQRFSDLALLLLRLFVGLFLIWGVMDSVGSSESMTGFVGFLGNHGFPIPRLLAMVSVYIQLAIGVCFVLGLFTRWAGLFCVVHFLVAIVMVDRHGGMRGIFPSGCLVFIGLFLATYGAGRLSIDAALRANDAPRSIGSVRLKK